MPITFIRHAESNGNLGNPAPNSSLSNNGIEQAKKLQGEYDLAICSTLRRARQTLDESQIVYNNVVFTDLCRESLDSNPNSHYNGEIPCSESDEQVVKRVNLFIDFLREKERDHSRIVVISHCLFLRRMTGYFFNNCATWTVTSSNEIKKV